MYPAKDICLWIDPLDCTQGFISNRKHETTILIGVAFQGRPILGLIGHPYKLHNNTTLYCPTVYLGSTELEEKCAYEFNISQNNVNVLSPLL